MLKRDINHRHNSFFYRTFSNPFFKIGLAFGAILFLLMFIIFIAEQKTNSEINSFFDAFWYTLVTITTVGYGDITPDSIPGRIAGIFLLIFGVVIFAGFSGKMASVLFDRQMKQDRGLLKLQKISNHFIICGWKPEFDKILEGVLDANLTISLEKIVLINNAPSDAINAIRQDPRFTGIQYISGDFTDENILNKANIKTAERALVLSDKSENYSPLEIDSRTVLAVLTIENLNPRIYIAAELLDSKFEKHLSMAHCDEIILGNDCERQMVVSASSGTGLSNVLRELISTNDGILIEDIPNEFIGKTYKEMKQSNHGRKVLIGFLENTGNFYERRKEALKQAQKTPDMKKIVSNLQKVKLLKSNHPFLTPPDDYVISANSKAIFVKGAPNGNY